MKVNIIILFLVTLVSTFHLRGQNQEADDTIKIIETNTKPPEPVLPKTNKKIYHKKENGKYIIINNILNRVDTLNYQFISGFYHGFAAFKENEKWGFLDTAYNIFIFPEYDEIKGYDIVARWGGVKIPVGGYSSYGLVYVKKNGKWAIIDTNGKVLTLFKYDYISYLQDGFMKFNIGGYIKFDINRTMSGLGEVPRGGNWGFIDLKGNEYLMGTNDGFRDVSEGLSVIWENGKFGFFDVISGKISIPLRYDHVGDFHNNRAIFCNGGFWEGTAKWGFLDKKGNELNTRVYDFADDFNDGISIVNIGGHGRADMIDEVKGGKWGVVDVRDSILIPIRYDKIKFIEKNNYIGVRLNEKWGAYNLQGDLILPCVFDDIKQFVETNNNRIFLVKINDKWGIIDDRNNIIVDFLYDDIKGFNSLHYSEAKRNGNSCFLVILK